MAEALDRALTMPLPERMARHRGMLARLTENNLLTLAGDRFLDDLQSETVTPEVVA